MPGKDADASGFGVVGVGAAGVLADVGTSQTRADSDSTAFRRTSPARANTVVTSLARVCMLSRTDPDDDEETVPAKSTASKTLETARVTNDSSSGKKSFRCLFARLSTATLRSLPSAY